MTNKPTWADEFDSKFTYLPPKDNKQMLCVENSEIIGDMLNDMKGGSILLPATTKIKPLDNADVRQELKDFISTKLAEQRQEIIEIIEKEKETHDGFGKNYLNQIINLIKQK